MGRFSSLNPTPVVDTGFWFHNYAALRAKRGVCNAKKSIQNYDFRTDLERFQDFMQDFKISSRISGFQVGFQDF